MLSSLSLRGAARAWCSAGARGVVSQAQRSALSTAAAGDFDIKRVGVVGMGLMGHGIAQSAAEAGLDVMAVDANADAVAAGEAAVRKSLGGSLGKQVAKGKLEQAAADARFEEVMGRFGTSSDLAAVADCDIVVEAIIEDLEIKKSFWSDMGSIVQPGAIFASNTSSFRIELMAGPSGRPDRFVGLHFFNPVQIMKLVEVVRTPQTSDAAFDATLAFGKALGKETVSCLDTPGFVVNRLLVPYLAQAVLLLERGEATADDIDTAMRFGAGHPMGPITLADYVGLDTTLYILEGWVRDYPDESAFVVPNLLREKVAAGKLGRKSGEGFFKWEGNKRV